MPSISPDVASIANAVGLLVNEGIAMQKAIAILLLCLLGSGSALSGPIKGAGATTCGLWVEDRKINNHSTQLNWVLGFISAYNEYVFSGPAPSGVFGNADANAVAVWLDNYCQQNPLSTPYAGARELVRELESRLPK